MWVDVIQETKLSAELEGIFGIVPWLNPIYLWGFKLKGKEG